MVISGIFMTSQTFALPPSSQPLPFEIALWLPYQLYWLIALTVGAFVCGKIIILAERSKQTHLWDVFWVMGSFFLVVLFAGLTEQSRAGPFDDNLSRIADMAALTLLPISIPRLVESNPELASTDSKVLPAFVSAASTRANKSPGWSPACVVATATVTP
jgi:hypothetical protein